MKAPIRSLVRSSLMSVGVVLLGIHPVRAEPRLGAVHTLSTGRMQVEVMNPLDPECYYRGIRFSPVATVLKVILDGKEFLFCPAGHNPMVHNAGLAMEFDLPQTEFGPQGFAEAAVGSGFLKIGVGVLKKFGEKYAVWLPFEVMERAQTNVKWERDRALFRQTCKGVNGYAYALDAEVSVADNVIAITYKLTNTGARAFATEQYVHNFFHFDGRATGPDYEVEFPGEFDVTIPKPVIEKHGRTLRFIGGITPEMIAADAMVAAKDESRKFDSVVVRNAKAGMEIHASVSIPAQRVVVHAGPEYVCPEQFVKISLNPGESRQWVRTYEFQIIQAVEEMHRAGKLRFYVDALIGGFQPFLRSNDSDTLAIEKRFRRARGGVNEMRAKIDDFADRLGDLDADEAADGPQIATCIF